MLLLTTFLIFEQSNFYPLVFFIDYLTNKIDSGAQAIDVVEGGLLAIDVHEKLEKHVARMTVE